MFLHRKNATTPCETSEEKEKKEKKSSTRGRKTRRRGWAGKEQGDGRKYSSDKVNRSAQQGGGRKYSSTESQVDKVNNCQEDKKKKERRKQQLGAEGSEAKRNDRSRRRGIKGKKSA